MRRLVPLLLLLPLLAVGSAAEADTRSLVDDNQLDPEIHRDIDIHKITVTYHHRKVTARLEMKNLSKVRRLRFFVAFMNKTDEQDVEGPNYGNFVEMRLAPSGAKSTVNWIFDPSTDGYQKKNCQGTKATPDYRRDVITYVLPRRCFNFLKGQSYIRSYVSARKYTAAHWQGGDPVLSTGDWFDTTYEVRTPK